MIDIWTAAERYATKADASTRPGGPTHCERLHVTSRAYTLVYAIDRALVGTGDYMGLAYWWSDVYKHRLRGATTKQRRRAHDAILAAGLPLDGESVRHREIIDRATRRRATA
jgi:hypothetical protein